VSRSEQQGWPASWRAGIERQEAAHALIRRADAMPSNSNSRFGGRPPSSFLNGDGATVTCERFDNPLTRVSGGCGGHGYNFVAGGRRVLCPLCQGAGRLMSTKALRDERARFSLFVSERRPDASDEALAAHNARLIATSADAA
jgi:hypothetical protein